MSTVRKGKALKRSPFERGSKGLAPRSAKRQAIMPERRALVERLLRERPLCESPRHARGCDGRATDVHEIQTRARGGSILDEANCVTLSRLCHDYWTTHPAEALEVGMMANSWQESSDTA